MVASHLCFRRTADVSFAFSSLFFLVPFELDCVVCPSSGLAVVSVGCYINIARRKPVSKKKHLVPDLNMFLPQKSSEA